MTSIDDPARTTEQNRTDDRIGLIHVDDDVLLYDVENPSAWIQAGETVALDRHR
jgi:hypothetical protein